MAPLIAQKNWILCFDKDMKSCQLAQIRNQIRRYEADIDCLGEGLNLEDDTLKDFHDKCVVELDKAVDAAEREIELRERPPDFVYNKKALINLTDIALPEDIQIALSFGYKFLFPYIVNSNNLHRMTAQLEMTIEDALPEGHWFEASFEISRILQNFDPFLHDKNMIWLRFLNHRTSSFLGKRTDVFATKSDKGGHTVLMSVLDYENKLLQHLSCDSYIEFFDDQLLSRLIQEEVFLIDSFKNAGVFTFFNKSIAFQPAVLQLPRFYGLPKIHKANCPLRPITSTLNSVGRYLSDIFLLMLDIVFSRSNFHIRDSYEFVDFINNTEIDDDDILVSFDIVSMYTSIPFSLAFDLILSHAEKFEGFFNVDRALLSRSLEFLLKDISVFSALKRTFRFRSGLPMGSCLSPIVARLVMDKIVYQLLSQIPSISFIKVFVDDTIAAMKDSLVYDALNVLNNLYPGVIVFTVEKENSNLRSINFLNVTLIREHKFIITNWYRKGYASGRLVNFYSSHKRSIIFSTAEHFLKTILVLSDPKFFHENETVAFETLINNSFPRLTVVALMNECYTYMKPFNKGFSSLFSFYLDPFDNTELKVLRIMAALENDSTDKSIDYVIFPHSTCFSKEIKRILNLLKRPDVVLADSIRNNKINPVTVRKDVISDDDRSNMILISRCHCGNKFVVDGTRFNETVDIAKQRLITTSNDCRNGSHAFNDFSLERGFFYKNQTSYLLRYIQWRYRHALSSSLCSSYSFPGFFFTRLIDCLCCNEPSD